MIYQINYLSKIRRVIAIDLPGFGKSYTLQTAYSLDDYVFVVKGLIDSLNCKVDILCHSFGGRIAIKLCAICPNIENVVFTGCAGLKPKFSLKRLVKTQTFKILKKFVNKDKLCFLYSSDYNQLSPIMKQSFIKIVSEHLDSYLRKINNNALLIFGKRDRETPLYYAKRMSKNLPLSRLKVIDKAGHFCFLEKPNQFNLLVESFLREGEL